MKVAVAFAIVAACIAATYAVPAPHAIDWERVAAKVWDIEAAVTSAIQIIKAIANDDNAEVGSQIEDQLNAAAASSEAILEQVSAKIVDQSLTLDDALELLKQLQEVLISLQQDLQDELGQLSTGAAGQINDTFFATYATIGRKAGELYALLGQ